LTEHISATEHDINNWKETCQSTLTSLCALKIWWIWSRISWERLASFAHPYIFTLGDNASLTVWTLYNSRPYV